MTLLTSELRSFLKRTSYIKHSNILPVLDHLLIEPGRIIKSNLDTFCSMKITSDQSVLIEEKTLAAILTSTTDEYINIEIKDKVIIGNGKAKVSHPITDVQHYPKMPDLPDEKGFDLNQQMIDAITISGNFVSELETDNALQAVNIKDDFIAATDRYKLYYESFKTKFPNIIIQKEHVPLISQLIEPLVYCGDKRYYFVSDNITYSFAKTEDTTPDFKLLASRFNGEAEQFIINKQALIDFCNLVNSINDSRVAICKMTASGFELIDEDKPVSWPYELPGIDFKFNARTMAPALKQWPDSELRCKVVNNALVITDSDSLIAFNGIV